MLHFHGITCRIKRERTQFSISSHRHRIVTTKCPPQSTQTTHCHNQMHAPKPSASSEQVMCMFSFLDKAHPCRPLRHKGHKVSVIKNVALESRCQRLLFHVALESRCQRLLFLLLFLLLLLLLLLQVSKACLYLPRFCWHGLCVWVGHCFWWQGFCWHGRHSQVTTKQMKGWGLLQTVWAKAVANSNLTGAWLALEWCLTGAWHATHMCKWQTNYGSFRY